MRVVCMPRIMCTALAELGVLGQRAMPLPSWQARPDTATVSTRHRVWLKDKMPVKLKGSLRWWSVPNRSTKKTRVRSVRFHGVEPFHLFSAFELWGDQPRVDATGRPRMFSVSVEIWAVSHIGAARSGPFGGEADFTAIHGISNCSRALLSRKKPCPAVGEACPSLQ